MMKLALLAEKINGQLDGDGQINVTGVAGVAEARMGDVSFIDNPKYAAYVAQCKASVLIVNNELETDFRPLIRADNPYLAFTQAIELLAGPGERPQPGIHPSAVISESAWISPDATVMANVVIEQAARIESGTVLYPGVVIGAGSRIERDVTVYPNVTIHSGVFIGQRVIIHSGVTLGSDPGEKDIEQPALRLEIGADVEIGANGTVVAGVRQPTRIGKGTKLDNLVHIDHDVTIGEDNVIVAMVTIEPEVKIGREVTIAGQVGVKRGVTIGDRAIIGARSVVAGDVPPERIFSGVPAIAHDQEKRIKAALQRLPKLYRRVQIIEDWLSGPTKND